MPRPADPNARASLMSAARAEFVKSGLRGARIEDITSACGLSKGAFYLHFTSKEALFGEVLAVMEERLGVLSQDRLQRMEAFYSERPALTAKDLEERSERYVRLVQMETELDLRTLELMWEYRDVMQVLLCGSQGTDFAQLFWVLLDREVERVAVDFRRLQGSSACRMDISPKLFGSVIVGAYTLLVQQMSRMEEKPDLARWARELQQLFREGIMSRAPAPAAGRVPRATGSRPSPRRSSARASTRKHPRKP